MPLYCGDSVRHPGLRVRVRVRVGGLGVCCVLLCYAMLVVSFDWVARLHWVSGGLGCG